MHSLLPCHVSVLASYWGAALSGSSYFISHCISNYESVGISTDANPPQLVSWAIRYPDGPIGHLYTLEEYRGRGLASAVMREMCCKIQANREVPFCGTSTSNKIAVALFKKLGFTESDKDVCVLASSKKN